MTQKQAISFWQEGATQSLRDAQTLLESGSYASALFHCHLAVEKAMKAAIVGEKNVAPPFTHSLTLLAEQIKKEWTAEQRETLEELTRFAIAARYEDLEGEDSTASNVLIWLQKAQMLVAALSSPTQ